MYERKCTEAAQLRPGARAIVKFVATTSAGYAQRNSLQES